MFLGNAVTAMQPHPTIIRKKKLKGLQQAHSANFFYVCKLSYDLFASFYQNLYLSQIVSSILSSFQRYGSTITQEFPAISILPPPVFLYFSPIFPSHSHVFLQVIFSPFLCVAFSQESYLLPFALHVQNILICSFGCHLRFHPPFVLSHYINCICSA